MMSSVVGTLRRALIIVVAAALLASCSGSDEPDAEPRPESPSVSGSVTPSPSPSEPVDIGPVVRCPEGTAEIDPALPDAVPEGATSVRLCDGGADEVAPPRDALTTDVAEVVAAVNDQPVATRNCADRQLPTYQLAFGYPDGTSFVVAGRFTRCAELLVGSVRRAEARPALRAFVHRLQAQRAELDPPAAVDAASLRCDQPRRDASLALADPVSLAVAVFCRDGKRVVVPAADRRKLAADLRRPLVARETTFGCALPLVGSVLVGANAWGDPITLTWDCLGFSVTEDLEWRPRGEARRVVARLADRADRAG